MSLIEAHVFVFVLTGFDYGGGEIPGGLCACLRPSTRAGTSSRRAGQLWFIANLTVCGILMSLIEAHVLVFVLTGFDYGGGAPRGAEPAGHVQHLEGQGWLGRGDVHGRTHRDEPHGRGDGRGPRIGTVNPTPGQ